MFSVDISDVKKYLNKIVYYDIGKAVLDKSDIKEYIFLACTIRRVGAEFKYSATIKSLSCQHSISTVPLENVLKNGGEQNE